MENNNELRIVPFSCNNINNAVIKTSSPSIPESELKIVTALSTADTRIGTYSQAVNVPIIMTAVLECLFVEKMASHSLTECFIRLLPNIFCDGTDGYATDFWFWVKNNFTLGAEDSSLVEIPLRGEYERVENHVKASDLNSVESVIRQTIPAISKVRYIIHEHCSIKYRSAIPGPIVDTASLIVSGMAVPPTIHSTYSSMITQDHADAHHINVITHYLPTPIANMSSEEEYIAYGKMVIGTLLRIITKNPLAVARRISDLGSIMVRLNPLFVKLQNFKPTYINYSFLNQIKQYVIENQTSRSIITLVWMYQRMDSKNSLQCIITMMSFGKTLEFHELVLLELFSRVSSQIKGFSPNEVIRNIFSYAHREEFTCFVAFLKQTVLMLTAPATSMTERPERRAFYWGPFVKFIYGSKYTNLSRDNAPFLVTLFGKWLTKIEQNKGQVGYNFESLLVKPILPANSLQDIDMILSALKSEVATDHNDILELNVAACPESYLSKIYMNKIPGKITFLTEEQSRKRRTDDPREQLFNDEEISDNENFLS